MKKFLTELLDKAKNEEKKDASGSIDKIVGVKAEINEGEALGRAYSAGQQTSYFIGENHYPSTSTTSKIYYKRSKMGRNDGKKKNAAEMVHSPVAENLIETRQAGVTAQVYGRIKNELGGAIVIPQQDLYEKEKAELFNRTHKALKEFIYATSGVVTWFSEVCV